MPAHVQREYPYRRISPPPANNPRLAVEDFGHDDGPPLVPRAHEELEDLVDARPRLAGDECAAQPSTHTAQPTRIGLPGRPALPPCREGRDATLTPDGIEPDWPDADVVIGNPPFLGYSPQRGTLGEDYVNAMRRLYKGAVPAFADLVCYWFYKAGKLVANSASSRSSRGPATGATAERGAVARYL